MSRLKRFTSVGMAACLFAATTLLAMPQAQNNKQRQSSRWAVLVGVNDYAELSDLEYCVSDQVALKDQLIAAGFPEKQVFLLHDKRNENKYRPFKANIERQLELVLGLAERDDLVLVAFSGHGVHFDGQSYLCPIEARLAEPKQTMVLLDAVYQQLSKSRASFKLFLVDACRNDPRPGGQRSAKPARSTTDFATSLERVPQGILLWSSCAPGQISMEEKKFGRGVFMHYLIEGMKGSADEDEKIGDKDGKVSLQELYRYAQRETKVYVATAFNDFQTPMLRGEITDLEFVIADRATRRMDLPKPLTTSIITNSIGMKLAYIPPGEFQMGSGEPATSLAEAFKKYESSIKPEYFDDEFPQHRVRITKGFHMGVHEVTIGQFRQFVLAENYKTEAERDGKGGWGNDASTGKFEQKTQYSWQNSGWPQGDDHPVVNVTWNDATAFCGWLSRKDGRTYRLPTEAEWEYACRAGTKTRWYNGDDPERLVDVGNVADGTAKEKFSSFTTIGAKDGFVFTAPVGKFKPNAFGLFDMHGNVWEWCSDLYDAKYYEQRVEQDPQGLSSNSYNLCVLRGGSWDDYPWSTRSANRSRDAPDYRSNYMGYRVVCSSLP